ncbi:LexA family protein [Methylobacterium fujisawaense]|uniref:LexA family protein n=1 Tax=Methylobacterium fujisawaense TaxID=107400 RepID=UPI00313B9A80
MPRDIRERIQERLDEIGKSKRAASLDGGLGADAIRDLMRRPDDSPTLETVAKLADGLQTTPAWLAFEAGPKTPGGQRSPSLVNANRSFTLAKVDGPVAAGMFLARPAFDDDLGEVISAPRDPEYPFARQIAYRVEGDSMDKAQPRPIRHGDFIICAAWEDLDLEERDGLIVVVQQTLASEQLRERSVKVLKLHKDRREFVPMSSNPEHQSIVVPRNDAPDDGREVKIIALVRYVFDNQPIR